ncbi:MAG: S41 family peptidase [Planctomycetota bacterium]
MPKRNLLLLCLMTAIGLVSWLARDRSQHGRRFGEVMAAIERLYLEPVDEASLFRAAMTGVFSKLDEHSAFIDGEQRQALEAALNQEFGGVGLELAIDARDGTLTVESPVVGSPAWRVGIAVGDKIIAIDGATTRGMKVGDAVALLRGPVGRGVTLEIAGEAGSHEVSLVRETVRTESVLGDRRLSDGSWDWFIEGESGIAFIRLTGFGERTLKDLDGSLEAIQASQSTRGIILDLRGNPGGLLSVAIDVCDRFLDDGIIVSTRGRARVSSQQKGVAAVDLLNTHRATQGVACAGVPMAVLIDGLTASAGEIVAACLQDNHRAHVVGSRSFGKGTVQSILPLLDGESLLKLTTSEYLRPSSANIHRAAADADDAVWGVSPDRGHEITPTAETLGGVMAWRKARDVVLKSGDSGAMPVASQTVAQLPRSIDPVLAKAIEAILDHNGVSD